jgi:hypothetical protein
MPKNYLTHCYANLSIPGLFSHLTKLNKFKRMGGIHTSDGLLLALKYVTYFFLNNQPDALIIQIYSDIELYMFLAFYLPIIRSSLIYILHW